MLKELAEEEDARIARGGAALHEMSPVVFLTLAIDLEDAQYVAPFIPIPISSLIIPQAPSTGSS